MLSNEKVTSGSQLSFRRRYKKTGRQNTKDSKDSEQMISSCENRMKISDYQLFNTLDTNSGRECQTIKNISHDETPVQYQTQYNAPETKKQSGKRIIEIRKSQNKGKIQIRINNQNNEVLKT